MVQSFKACCFSGHTACICITHRAFKQKKTAVCNRCARVDCSLRPDSSSGRTATACTAGNMQQYYALNDIRTYCANGEHSFERHRQRTLNNTRLSLTISMALHSHEPVPWGTVRCTRQQQSQAHLAIITAINACALRSHAPVM